MGYGSLDPRELKRLRARQRRQNMQDKQRIAPQHGNTLQPLDVPIEAEHDTAPFSDTWADLLSSLQIRGLFVHRMENGRYTITLKVTLPGGLKGYRYGTLRSAAEVPAVLDHWLREGYWTPDRQ